MSYICTKCGATFPTPEEADASFDHAFGTEKKTQFVCPFCESDAIEQAALCKNPHCRNARTLQETLCLECRTDLLRRIITFFDTLTAEEEAQFDEWMDGSSITERKNWRAAL